MQSLQSWLLAGWLCNYLGKDQSQQSALDKASALIGALWEIGGGPCSDPGFALVTHRNTQMLEAEDACRFAWGEIAHRAFLNDMVLTAQINLAATRRMMAPQALPLQGRGCVGLVL